MITRLGICYLRGLLHVLPVLLLVTSLGAATPKLPNVVLILADDLGWSDLVCYGADLHETPHLDALAGQGVRFHQAYAAAPVCTPTRASIMTGKHPARLHMTIWSEGSLKGPADRALIQADALHDLPLSEQTLAERFQAAGYLTALVGKWHLGDANHAPETQGFDINIGGTHWGAPQTFFWPYRGSGRFGSEFRYVPGLPFGKPGEYLTDRLTDESLRIIDQASQTNQPFFLYLAHHAPHTPIEAPANDIAHFASKMTSDLHHQHPVYAAMVRSLDNSVGRVMQKLRELKLDENTIVIFTSDNGGYIGNSNHAGKSLPITNNWPLRSGKASLYEGGLRVPLIVKWPGVTGAGMVCHEPVVSTDLFPTLTRLLSHASTANSTKDGIDQDGIDIAPLLKDPSAKLSRNELYFHYPHYYHAPATTPCGAIRAGNWKLIQWFEDDRVELFNLENDPSEQHDLASQQIERVDQLRAELTKWRTSVGAKMPRQRLSGAMQKAKPLEIEPVR